MSRCLQRLFSRRSTCAILLAVVAWCFLEPGPASAQPGDTSGTGFLEIVGKHVRADSTIAKDIWRSDAAISGAREARFRDFIVKLYLPQMTQAFTRENLPDFRRDFYHDLPSPGNPSHVDKLNTYITNFMYGIARGARQAKLNNGDVVYVYWLGSELYTLGSLKETEDGKTKIEYGRNVTEDVQALRISKRNFHPAVRYNAMRWLGELNSKPAKILKHRDGPKIAEQAIPYAKNFTLMLDVAVGKPYASTPERFKKTEVGPAPDAVRIAALLGLKRHLMTNPDRTTGDKNLVVGEMLSLANQQPSGTVGEGATWYRRLALEIVGMVGFAGADAQYFVRLDEILSNGEIPLPVRCAAAKALGMLAFNEAPTADLKLSAVADHLAQLILDICQAEVSRSEYTDEPMAAPRMLGMLDSVLLAFRGQPFATGATRGGDEGFEELSGILALMSDEDKKAINNGIVRPLQGIRLRANNAALKPGKESARKLMSSAKQMPTLLLKKED